MSERNSLDQLCINTIRFLSADAIQKANSGHPGMPMGAAAMAYVLWTRHLKHNPANPAWPDRDRFVLSAGHGSMLLYSLLHLTGYDLSLDDLKEFRQWESKTPGHPEYDQETGIEVTTGPLGQGLSQAIGMAIAEAHLAARFNRKDQTIVDHYTYVIASDGDLMEGVASEACSLAGHLRLGKLIVLYDDNKVTLAATTDLSFTENVRQRFEAYGWHVELVENGEDLTAIDKALQKTKNENDRPSLICVRTIIGHGAPSKQGTCGVHGAPLGPAELAAAKKNLGWPAEPDFYIPDEAATHFRLALARGEKWEQAWQTMFSRYEKKHPAEAAEFSRRMEGRLPEGWDADLPSFAPDEKGLATRTASENVMQVLAGKIPELMGGSADLNPSTLTWLKGCGDFQSPLTSPAGQQGVIGDEWGYGGRNIHFGVREHAMGAVASGLALHGGFVPYTATFLTFSDYMRPPMRLAAMSGLPVVYVFTHDSIGLGEDGPTHQPIEQVMSLRLIPNLTVIRPCDANETVEAWKAALTKTTGPTALILTRQNVPVLDRAALAPADGLQRGGYILWQSGEGDPDIILMATGSEVSITLKAARILAKEGTRVRVLSMPSWELFDEQPPDYQEEVLPPSVLTRVAVEAGIERGWERYVGLEGEIIGMTHFGASAPARVLFEQFGFTSDSIAAEARWSAIFETVNSALQEVRTEKVVERIWAHDHTVWKPNPDGITNRLGWLHAPQTMQEHLPRILAFTGEIRAAGFTHALLLGMGGSSLAPEVLRKTFGVKDGYLDLAVLDSTDPAAILAQVKRSDVRKTLYIVSTKSGGTIETISLFKYFYNLVVETVGPDSAGSHFVAITDPGSGLADMAKRYHFRATFLNDPDIGGRYSALSLFGLVPAALLGVDLYVLLERAAISAAQDKYDPGTEQGDDPAAIVGVTMGELARAGRDKLTFILSEEITSFGDWIEQLIAESAGKEGQGILPVVGEQLGGTDVYGQDRLFIHLRLTGDQSQNAALQAIEEARHPIIGVNIEDVYDLGGQFFLWELITAIASARLGVNPFDQPDVESAKVLARKIVAEYGEKGILPPPEYAPLGADALRQFLAQSRSGDYVALHAYLQPSDDNCQALQNLRHRIRDQFKMATTVGFGPRFLHSTGQLHKGDAGHGLFVQFMAEDEEDVPIPDAAGSPQSSLTFGVLKAAQALGDRQALLNAGRRVITFHLKGDALGNLNRLVEGL